MKFSIKAAAAAVSLAIAGSAQAASINDFDVIVNIVRDGVTGQSMLVNTGLDGNDLMSGTIIQWTSDPAMTAAISSFITGGSDVSFWVAAKAANGFDKTALSSASLPSQQAVNGYFDTEFPTYQNAANIDPAFAASPNPWLAGIEPTDTIHYTNVNLYGNGLVEAIDLGLDGVLHATTFGFFSGFVQETLNSWTLAADGTLGYAPPVSQVPVPAAVWLFGSGLIGLIGVARRRNA